MRAIFLGKKPSSVEALRYLIEKGVEVTAVVAPDKEHESHWEPKLTDAAKDLKIPLLTEEELYQCIAHPQKPPRKELSGCVENIDVVFSFLFWNRIKKPLITLPKKGAINFHPAPLPDLRGVGGYNLALYERLDSWGVSAHFIAEDIDEGDIIYVERFPINPVEETVSSLEQESQKFLVAVFKKVVDNLLLGKKLPRKKQGKGRYFSKKDFEKLRKISPSDNAETIQRKIHAFWYPPYPGASIEIGEKEYTLANDAVLKDVSKILHRRAMSGKKGYIEEQVYAEAVANLTLKYVDILVVLKSQNKPDRFVLGKRKENPGKDFIWPAGGRSKHFMPYKRRAEELVKEDFGITPDPSHLAFIGTARLYWPNSRFEARKGVITTDGDITIYALELPEKIKLKTGTCFTKLYTFTEAEARKQNEYAGYIIDCYKHYKKHGTPQPVPREFHF